ATWSRERYSIGSSHARRDIDLSEIEKFHRNLTRIPQAPDKPAPNSKLLAHACIFILSAFREKAATACKIYGRHRGTRPLNSRYDAPTLICICSLPTPPVK